MRGYIVNQMKVLLTTLVLFFSSNIFAKEFNLFDLTIGSKLTNYFSDSEISLYYADNMEKTVNGETVFGKEFKYSAIEFYGNEKNDQHDFIQIYYENETYKIVGKSGLIINLEFNECITLRDLNISKFDKKKLLNRSKVNDFQSFPNGMEDHFVVFYGDEFNIGFRCYAYEDGHVVYRYTSTDNIYNKWLNETFK